MKIGTHYISPDKTRARFFDGMEGQSAELSFLCGACKSKISFDVWDYLDIADEWSDRLPKEELVKLKKMLNLPKPHQFYTSHEGNQPYLSVQKCPKCNHAHLVYLGFGEVQPQRYSGTLQGVYEAIT